LEITRTLMKLALKKLKLELHTKFQTLENKHTWKLEIARNFMNLAKIVA